jgi:lipoate-protein ligase A
MEFLSLTLPTLAENIALDEALLMAAESETGHEILRIWEWEAPAAVLGAGGKLAEDVDRDACAKDGVPILRRSSGGGTVLLGPGCLLYSLVLAYDRAAPLRAIATSYEYILDRICAYLAVPGLRRAGTSDLALGGRKVSGNAQQRKRGHLLHHGSLLYDFDAMRAERYLLIPGRQPEYRQQRSHSEFLTNLPLERGDLITSLRAAFAAETETAEWPRERVGELVETKYQSAEWTMRR